MSKEKKVEATNLDKSVSSSSSSGSPTGRKNGARKQSYSEGLFAVIDSMCEKTNLFEKQWTELQSLITDSEKSLRLAEKIRDLYTTVDQKAGKKRQELQGRMATSSSVGEKGTFKDLQKSLALTARKIYECAEDVPDEEKCRRAAEFVEEVLSEFKRMHFPALAFLQRCFLYACPKLWSDREAIMAAVQQDGLALQMAPGELKNNREVVIAAVRNNSLARQFASNELLSDVEVEMAVHDNDVQSLENSPEWFFTNTLQSNDMRFAIDIHRNHVDLCNSTSLAELLDKSSNLEQALKLLEEMEKSAEGDPRLQTRRQQQGDDPYSLKELIASKRKQRMFAAIAVLQEDTRTCCLAKRADPEDAHAIPDCSSDPVGFQTDPYLHSGGLNYDAAVRRI